jgi:hypothetical protein
MLMITPEWLVLWMFMAEPNKPIERHIREPKTHTGVRSEKASVPPPLPEAPELHPEKAPPNVPIPGEPTVEGGTDLFICEICGKVFNSKDELQLHIQTDHAPKKTRK